MYHLTRKQFDILTLLAEEKDLLSQCTWYHFLCKTKEVLSK